MSTEDFDKMPQGYLRFRFTLSIPLFKFSFCNEFDQCLFVSEIEGQEGTVELGKGFTRAHFQT